MATTSPPPPASSSSASPSSPSSSSSSSTIGRGTLLVGVASPSTIETFLASLRGKKWDENKSKVVLRQCYYKEMLPNQQLYSQNLNE